MGLGKVLLSSFGGGSPPSPPLSDDSTLSIFTIDDEDVLGLLTVDKGSGTSSVSVAATPAHPNATRTINLSSDANPVTINVSEGDNIITTTVIAEDGVATQDYIVTVHVFNTGTPERTEFTFTSGWNEWNTAGAGHYIVISDVNGAHVFWGNTGAEYEPPVEGALSFTEVVISGGDGASDLASNFHTAMTASLFDSLSLAGNTFLVQDKNSGERIDASTSQSYVTISITQQGVNPS